MRTETDALLSLQRYVALALPAFTEILTEVENEAPERPFAVVSADGDARVSGKRDAPWVELPVTIYAYVRGTTRKAARQAAEAARNAVMWALLEGAREGAEQLVPLYDYTGRPAVQRVTITGATSGTWALALAGIPTAAIPLEAQPVDIRLALEALATVGVGDAVVFGRAGGPWEIRFDGEMRGDPVATLTVDTSGLAGPAVDADVDVLSVGAPEPWRDPRDYLRVLDVAPGGLRDPDDPRLRTVTVGLRLSWGRSTARRVDRTLTGVEVRRA